MTTPPEGSTFGGVSDIVLLRYTGDCKRSYTKWGNDVKKAILYLVLAVFSTLLLVGCSGQQNTESQNGADGHDGAREIAWDFVKANGWHHTASEKWQSAEVTKVVANNNYELLDETYDGQEVLSVTFEDEQNSVVGTPLILIEPDTNKVIGYMPTE